MKCYYNYISFSVEKPPSRKLFISNMEEKIKDEEFLGDIKSLISPDEKYDPVQAWEMIRTEFLEKL